MKKKSKERKAAKKRKASSVFSKRGLNSSRTISNKKPPTSLFKPLKIQPNSTLVMQPPSKYAATLLDPFRFRGIRIPDLACHPSVTYSLEYDTTITLIPGSSVAGNYDGIIIPLCGNPGFKYYQNTSGVMTGSTTSVTAAQTCFGNASNVASSYSQSRIVSAQVVVKFAGDDNAQAGSIVGAFVQAADTLGSAGQANTVLTSRWLDQGHSAASANLANLIEGTPTDNPEFLKRRQAYMGPITDGLILQYRPADADDFIYRQTSNGVNQTSFGAGAPIFNINCGFVFGIRGVPALAPRVFTMSVVVNFEALPVDDNIGLPGVGVYVNPAAQAYGLNAAANFPIATSATALDFANQAKAVSGM
jgi:hypothetical protein